MHDVASRLLPWGQRASNSLPRSVVHPVNLGCASTLRPVIVFIVPILGLFEGIGDCSRIAASLDRKRLGADFCVERDLDPRRFR